jgi:hypothetical protein
VLCGPCAAQIAPGDGLIREHVTSRRARTEAAGWLIDGFGAAHAVGAERTAIGRRPDADLVILHGSISRAHAELHRISGAWQIRDLGSRNRTQLEGRRVEGRGALPDRALLRFGDVGLYFIGAPVPLPDLTGAAVATTHAATSAFRFTLRGAGVDLCVLGSQRSDDAGTGGALMYRGTDASGWTEMSLPPLEFQLLRTLCLRALEEADSPSRARGCVPTKQLAKVLPFQSRFANEENVRQLVRRIRATLDGIGAAAVIEALPGRGYYLAWPIAAS